MYMCDNATTNCSIITLFFILDLYKATLYGYHHKINPFHSSIQLLSGVKPESIL